MPDFCAFNTIVELYEGGHILLVFCSGCRFLNVSKIFVLAKVAALGCEMCDVKTK